ncbi:hypothetical protein LTR91_022751 [Friedmanniomyces endolithicus]|uniref:UFSP1/2/DUB catalytic domain-containing protein n=2 Tax=Dothideomycetidae TaxID=451867 RepID=A0AAN6HA57_9PEZI|nr:hypothetical protein LTR94_008971 [Friedmanniomyces endolithicus]KAK5146556.1 hypothetical protein LTR32_001883 [Rachicladosporium monterosium]KAK0779263.1 hypothetical protein LTR38_014501 [Friedmanniomyces endolithicus]KAK0782402.1 hypothetical protein LTR75_014411 [Friedmanniomyces endolithicus]KAK0782505.1 hypothetical protein LTR59_012125 [Friedmanniomyces endolithicus]
MKPSPISPRTATLLAAETDTNTLPAVLPQLSRLLSHSPNLQQAFLSHPSTPQVWKIFPTEGQWCGYRNLQMLLLALPSVLPATSPVLREPEFLKTKFTIPQLQSLIESAWTQGFNAHSRDQLGGRLVGTTTFIGTPEAEALLLSLGVPCTGHVFKGPEAWIELLDSVEEYFSSSCALSAPPDGKAVKAISDETPLKCEGNGGSVISTTRPPIFLQRPGHSITIIGLSRSTSGKRHLLVFDPAWSPPSALRRRGGGGNEAPTCGECEGWAAKWMLRQYRKGGRYLGRWREFETVSVD